MDQEVEFSLGKLNKMTFCFLCAESTRIRIAGSKVENSVDEGDESKIKPPVSLLCLLRHLKIALPSSSVGLESSEVKVEADLCNDCEWVVNRFSVLFQQCQNLQQECDVDDANNLFIKLQTELDFYLKKIFHRISNGARNHNFVQRYSTAMTNDPESVSQLEWIDKLRKEIFDKCSKMQTSLNPTVDPSIQTKIPNDSVQKSIVEMNLAGDDEESKKSTSLRGTSDEEKLSQSELNKSKSSDGSNPPKNFYQDSSTGRFCCTSCDKSFLHNSSVYKHYNAIHLQQRWKCDICSSVYNRRHSLVIHKKVCPRLLEMRLTKEKFENVYQFDCTACGKRFPLMDKLRRHQRAVHPPSRKFNCKPCKKSYKTWSTLREHNERIHLKRTWKGLKIHPSLYALVKFSKTEISDTSRKSFADKEEAVENEESRKDSFTPQTSSPTEDLSQSKSKKPSPVNQKYFKDLSTGRFHCKACDMSFRQASSACTHYT